MIDLNEIAQQLRSWGYGHLAEQVRYASMERDTLTAKLEKAERRASQFEGWWAGLQVSSEKALREASAKALDCEHHGRIIAETEAQLGALDRQHREADSTRGKYGVFLTMLHQSLEKLDASKVTTGQLVTELTKQVTRVLR